MEKAGTMRLKGEKDRDARLVSRLTPALVLVTLLVLSAARPLPGPVSVDKIRKTLSLGPHVGVCDRCHTMHSADATPQSYLLDRPDDNALCDECHETNFTPGGGGSYGGSQLYLGSAHGSDHGMVWPGPDPRARTEIDAAGKCVNCHDPHGRTDSGGLIRSLAVAREEALCLTCHDGSPATNVRTDITLMSYNHPAALYSNRHTGPDESQSSDFAASPVNRRHAECLDCHNPHVARGDGLLPPPPPAASKRLLGVSRILVLNGAAGTAPAYTFVPNTDTLTSPVTEYQLCFKCHSSWTVQPTGQTDFARVLNPNNPSFHPVEARGRDPGISPMAFTGGYTSESLVACGDCHGSDSGLIRGPHGSNYEHVLKADYPTTSFVAAPDPTVQCFSCHAFDVYANATSPDPVRRLSRFNKPGADRGHAEHVQELKISCYACHTTHGSATQPHLIVTGRTPGIVSITWDINSATCSPTCHAPKTYTANFPR